MKEGPGGLAPLRGQPALPLSLVGDGGAVITGVVGSLLDRKII